MFNRTDLGPTEQISYMNWVAEGVLNRNQPWQNWKPKYFALKGSEVCIFDSAPVGWLHIDIIILMIAVIIMFST